MNTLRSTAARKHTARTPARPEVRHKTVLYRTVVTLLVGAVLQACVLVPFPVVPENDEFESSNISWIEPGKSTRQNVIERLGDATVVRNDGDLAIYGQARTVAGWFFGGFWGSGGTMPIETKSLLLIGYDRNGIVSQTEVLHGKNSCAESGLCVEAEFELEETGRLMEHESNLVNAVVYDAPSQITRAQQIPLSNGVCGVYVYSSGADEFLHVEAAELGLTSVTIRGYLYWEREPGTVSLQSWRRGSKSSLALECPTDERRFVSLYVDGRASWNGPKITIEPEETGQARILARKRILR